MFSMFLTETNVFFYTSAKHIRHTLCNSLWIDVNFVSSFPHFRIFFTFSWYVSQLFSFIKIIRIILSCSRFRKEWLVHSIEYEFSVLLVYRQILTVYLWVSNCINLICLDDFLICYSCFIIDSLNKRVNNLPTIFAYQSILWMFTSLNILHL